MGYKDRVLNGAVNMETRPAVVHFHNTLQATPTIEFVEETVTKLPDGTIQRVRGESLTGYFNDLATTFPKFNPVNGNQKAGDWNYGDVQEILYSLYRALAAARDAG